MPLGTPYFYVAYRVAVGNCKEMNKDGDALYAKGSPTRGAVERSETERLYRATAARKRCYKVCGLRQATPSSNLSVKT